MENKDLIIIALIVLTVYLAYQQTHSKSLNIQPSNKEIQDLKQQVQHYQALYQKRVAKDIAGSQEQKIKELTLTNQQLASNLSSVTQQSNFFQEKTTSLENQLLNLAKQKIKGRKDSEQLLNQLETNWSKKKLEWEKEIKEIQTKWKTEQEHWSQEKQVIQQKNQKDKEVWKSKETDYSKKLSELKKDQEQKEQTIIGLNNSYEKLAGEIKEKNKHLLNKLDLFLEKI